MLLSGHNISFEDRFEEMSFRQKYNWVHFVFPQVQCLVGMKIDILSSFYIYVHIIFIKILLT